LLLPNGPELSCGNEVPQQRNPVRAWHVKSDSNWLLRACEIIDGWFRQLERLVSPHHNNHGLIPSLKIATTNHGSISVKIKNCGSRRILSK
jgi:hypothetical protein